MKYFPVIEINQKTNEALLFEFGYTLRSLYYYKHRHTKLKNDKIFENIYSYLHIMSKITTAQGGLLYKFLNEKCDSSLL
jgi:hypothetical protein